MFCTVLAIVKVKKIKTGNTGLIKNFNDYINY